METPELDYSSSGKIPIKMADTPYDWVLAIAPTLAMAKDYESERRNEAPLSEGHEWEKEPEISEIVRFSDCDPFGHLNNSRYLDYFMNARDCHLKNAYHVDLATHSVKHQENWIVKDHRIAYLKPVKPKESILIRSRLLHYNESETVVESLMLSEDGRQFKSILWSCFAYINLKTGKPARHPGYIMNILAATLINVPEYPQKDFEGRIRSVRSEIRTQFFRKKKNRPT